MRHIFFVEIGTEELPPKRLKELVQSFAKNVHLEFDYANIVHNEISWFASPRRLAVKVMMLVDLSVYEFHHSIGPGIMQIFNDDGSSLSTIIKSWSNIYGVEINHSKYTVNYQGKWLIYRELGKDITVHNLLCKIISRALKKISKIKMMRWGTSKFEFVRPIHTVTILLDDQVILGKVFDIDVARVIYGHRFFGQSNIILNNVNDYLNILMEQGYVIADHRLRKQIIHREVEKAAKDLGGFVKVEDGLLEEVTSLVEWPSVFVGRFKKEFLKLPKEVLIDIIEYSQRYFVVINLNQELLPFFIFVTNTIKSTNSKDIIINNEKVICSKLLDASNLFYHDSSMKLEEYLPCLNSVVFHKKLGTLLDKTKRVEQLSSWISIQIGANMYFSKRAAKLAKCDLLSNMVIEFPRVQGVIGMYYALRDGEPDLVSLAQKEYYYPRFSGDILPTTQVSCVLAIADRMDTLSGIFGIQEYPKSDGDPFALRRAAIGILRIITEKKIVLDLLSLVKYSLSLYGKNFEEEFIINKIINFLYDRLCVLYKNRGYKVNIIRAILKSSLMSLSGFEKRINVVHDFCSTKDFFLLRTIIKRISNILVKSKVILNCEPQTLFFEKPEEFTLFSKLIELDTIFHDMFREQRYSDILMELHKLCELTNIFLNCVMIMVGNEDIRTNRFALLHKVYKLLTILVDFSLLV